MLYSWLIWEEGNDPKWHRLPINKHIIHQTQNGLLFSLWVRIALHIRHTCYQVQVLGRALFIFHQKSWVPTVDGYFLQTFNRPGKPDGHLDVTGKKVKWKWVLKEVASLYLLFLTGRCGQDSRMVRGVIVECIEYNITTVTVWTTIIDYLTFCKISKISYRNFRFVRSQNLDQTWVSMLRGFAA